MGIWGGNDTNASRRGKWGGQEGADHKLKTLDGGKKKRRKIQRSDKEGKIGSGEKSKSGEGVTETHPGIINRKVLKKENTCNRKI